MSCQSFIGHTAISRLRGAGLVAAFAAVAIACHSGDNGAGSNQTRAFDSTVFSIVPAGDGSGDVYVGGDFTSYNGIAVTRLVRLNADGTVDPAFATRVGFNGIVRSIAWVGDGSGDVYVGGDFTSYNGIAVTRLVRLNADGTVDPALVTGTGFTDTVFSIMPTADGSGRLYVGGAFTSYNGTTPANDLVRLNANGTVDLTFSTGTGFNDTVLSIAPPGDRSGDVYAGGQFTSYQSITIGRFVRLNSTASLVH
ncbi:MAG TPA: delta-60 repeat domain-containing protein [Candidatus Bathyarchaeia archaeon]|nr:delta-60 repeat domain-containing protein [Candidatus Bathyarchaeia archaeon]